MIWITYVHIDNVTGHTVGEEHAVAVWIRLGSGVIRWHVITVVGFACYINILCI